MLSRLNDNTIIKEIKRKSFTIHSYIAYDDDDILEDQWGLYDCEYGSIEIGNDATLRDLRNAESYVAQIYDTYTGSYFYIMCNSATICNWSIFLQAYNREFCNEFNTFKEAAEFNARYNTYNNNRSKIRNSAISINSTLRNRRRRVSIYN